MTFGVFLWLCVGGVFFAALCGGVVGAWIGLLYRPTIAAIGPMTLQREDEEPIPLKAKKRA